MKEFKLGFGNTMSWKEYKKEALKCIRVLIVIKRYTVKSDIKIKNKNEEGESYEYYSLFSKTC